MRGLLDRIRRAAQPPFHTLTAPEARALYARGAEVLDLPRAPLARVEDLTVPAGDGSPLPARVYAPSSDRLPVLLYMHGGGFTIGGLETHDSLCRQLALRSGAAVLSLDYRLAPQHRFPVAVDDSWAALRWLNDRGAESLGLDRTRLAVGGDSAGATLAAVAALWARDQGIPLRLQLLITPGTADGPDAMPSRAAYAEGFLLDATTIDWFFNQYITAADRADWRFAPLNADDVEGVAPACVVLAECDPLVDEGVAYADRLRAAGVPVELDIHRGMTHDFIKMGRALREALVAQAVAARALQTAFEAP
ncbi:MAG: alpha/beta hydrolase [Rhizobacter sp.]